VKPGRIEHGNDNMLELFERWMLFNSGKFAMSARKPTGVVVYIYYTNSHAHCCRFRSFESTVNRLEMHILREIYSLKLDILSGGPAT
jgi:hypothetical protein